MSGNDFKSFKDHLTAASGFAGYTPFVRKYFSESNLKAAVYMSVVVMLFEIWFIFRFIRNTFTSTLVATGITSIIARELILFIILLFMCVFVIVYALRHFKHKLKENYRLINGFLIVFSTVCMIFGTYISFGEYTAGKQILCFVTMSIFSMCLLVWRPWVSFIAISFAYSILYFLMNSESSIEMSLSMRIDYLMLWVTVVIVAFSAYQQHYSEAISREKLEKNNADLFYSDMHDSLTALGNDKWFVKVAGDYLAKNPETSYRYLYIDLENFKYFNETYGFDSGNELLKKVAEELIEIFPGEPVARFSDDHFIVLTQSENVKQDVNILRGFLDDERGKVRLDCKIGSFSSLRSKITDPSLALDRARYACNSIKKKYGEYYKEYDENLAADFHRKQYIINHIDEAVEKGWIKVYYQPVMWAGDLTLCGLEALARWDDPVYGFMNPGIFVPVLEEYRQIHKLDKGITEIVFRDIKDALVSDMPALPVSLNFSRIDFEMLDVHGLLNELYQHYDIQKRYIHVEVTESALSGNSQMLNSSLNQLRENNYPLWLDDFGSGYSSLNALKDYNFDVIKLDMIFLRNFDVNPKSRDVIKNIFNLTSDLKLDTLCEGVETEQQCSFLREVGCRRLQGYYFGKPMPKELLLQALDCGSIKLSDKLDYTANPGI